MVTHFLVRKNTKEYKKILCRKTKTLKTILFYPEENVLSCATMFFATVSNILSLNIIEYLSLGIFSF